MSTLTTNSLIEREAKMPLSPHTDLVLVWLRLSQSQGGKGSSQGLCKYQLTESVHLTIP